MRSLLFGGVAALLLSCGGDGGDDGTGPHVGSETNWLVHCDADDECGSLSCLCGFCTLPCDAGCGDLADSAECAPSGAFVSRGTCRGEAPPSAGLCTSACAVDNDCPTGATCSAGACVFAATEALAYPGAVGFGASVTGGRGGQVLRVTTLDATGAGSLQAALDAPGPRIIVFAVSGVIEAPLVTIPHGDVTIAGQSAPGAGITLRGRLMSVYDGNVENVLIRHLRIRPEYDGSQVDQFDAVQLSTARRVALDHVSIAFGVDESLDLFSATDVTVQNCSIESAMGDPSMPGTRRAGLIAGPESARISIVGTLFTHHTVASPALSGASTELVESVVYDASSGLSHANPAVGPYDLVANTFVGGPATDMLPFLFDDTAPSPSATLSYYLADNWLDAALSPCTTGGIDDPWSACSYAQIRGAEFRSVEPHELWRESDEYVPSTSGLDARAAYDRALQGAGAFPRDIVTRTAVADAADRTGSLASTYPADYLDGLAATAPPEDADTDGIDDGWERDHGLDPSDPSDNTRELASGYTAIEEYLNGLAEALVP